jgi:MinD-like ATPase involved in chromosome partitioning or flagellar assembly
VIRKKIILATGQSQINEAINSFENYEIVDVVDFKHNIMQAVKNNPMAITLVAGEGLTGNESLPEILIEVSKKNPSLNIVYIAGYVDLKDTDRASVLGLLVMSGIYNIIHDKKINKSILKDIIDNPRQKEDVSYLVKKMNDKTSNISKYELAELEDDTKSDEDDESLIYKKLSVFSSIKPGTGKSFVSTNVATAIAAFGAPKNGRKPRVAIIEADLQNLSVGTILHVEDGKKNLKTVMEKISTIIDKNNKLTSDEEKIAEVNDFIKESFKPYSRLNNLFALVGSQLSFNEINHINPIYYVYLIEVIMDEYDVILVDSNSSLLHITTLPLLQRAKKCFYILNLDFNNVRNNVRYRNLLTEIGIGNRVRYILNEDLSSSEMRKVEELQFTANDVESKFFDLIAKVPMLPKTVFLNRLYQGIPVVLDNESYTLEARYELMKIANDIWPIKNLKKIEDALQRQKDKHPNKDKK